MIRRSMLSIIGIAILINTLFPFRSTSAPLNYQRRASALTSSQGVPTRAQLTLSSDEVRPVPPRIPESETCALSRYNFQQASGLFAIVTGMEHSGTTIISEFIMSVPNLFGAFESGFLLDQSPSTFSQRRTFYNWSIRPVTRSLHWGLTTSQRDYVTQATCFAEMYRRVHALSPLMQPPNDKSWIIDKTPSYIYNLTHIIEKTPRVPVVVTVKDRADQLQSLMKRGVQRKGAMSRISAGEEALRQAQAKFPERIIVVNMTDLQRGPDAVMRDLFDQLHLTWRTAYMTMESLNRKGRHLGRCQVPAFNLHHGGPATKVIGDTCQDDNGFIKGKKKKTREAN